MRELDKNDQEIFKNWINFLYVRQVTNYEAALRILKNILDTSKINKHNTQFMQAALRDMSLHKSNLNSDHVLHFLELVHKGNPRLINPDLIKKYIPENKKELFAKKLFISKVISKLI